MRFFPWTGKMQKIQKFCLFSLVGQWALFTRCGPLLLSTRGGGIGNSAPIIRKWSVKKTVRPLLATGQTRDTCCEWTSQHAPNAQIPIPPPQVDSSKGPPGCTCAGGQFRPNLNIQAIKKIIHGLENIKNSAGNHLHPFLIFFEWLDAIFKITPSFQPPHLF